MAYIELAGAVYYGAMSAIIDPANNIVSKLLCRAAPIVFCGLLAADALSRLGYLG